ncbi:trichohyalin-like [Lytechinus variegatus]|uniref:trichohyalin-like n=1 Tax=Lytechinus variegatus TaxID=7654 RepID=UPI001BB23857|nr:trichohyalin-like [Lytechinus variegatus]
MFSSSSHGSSNQPAEVFRKDLISAMKLPDSSQLLPDEYMIMTDNWKPEWEKGVQVPVNPRSIPQAHIKEIRKPEDIDFKLSKKLIKGYDTDDEKEDDADAPEKKDAMCQYDLDEVDVHWLGEINMTREDMGDEPINELTMERIISECDVQCNNNMEHAMQTEEGLGIEYDEDVICDVCRAPDSEEGNEMVFCDKCDICVHQACYGIVNVPEGSWMCRTCALGIQPQCILCGIKGGAMKSTRSGTKWSHVSCALWVPEVSIGCVERMEPITKISQIPASRWALICVICRERTGACIQCSVKTCKTAYHVTCGFRNGLEMKTYLDDEADVRFRSYCQKHTKARREMDGIDGKLGTPDKAHGTPKKDIKEMTQEERANERAIRIQLVTEEFYRYTKLKDIVSALNMKDDVEMVDMVYEYWKLKRKSGHNKPLVTPTKEVGSMGSNEEYNLTARMKMFVHLRQDLERVRNLCYMVQRREKLSRQLSVLSQGIFRKQYDMHIAGKDRYSEEDLAWAINAGKFAIHLPASDSEATLTDTSTSTSKDCDTDDRLSKDCDTDDRSERENDGGGASERTAETQNGADTDAISSAGEEERRKDSNKECNEQESEDEKMEVAEAADEVVESEEEKDEAVKGDDDDEFELESVKGEEEEKEVETEGAKEVVSGEEEDKKEEVKEEEEKEIILKENVEVDKESPENLEAEQEEVKVEKVKEIEETTKKRRSRAREVEEGAVRKLKTRRRSRSREGDEEKRKNRRSVREKEAEKEKVEEDKEESWKSKRGLRVREVEEEEKEDEEQVVNFESKRRLRARDIKKEVEPEEEGDDLKSKKMIDSREVEKDNIEEDEETNWKTKRRLRARDVEDEVKEEEKEIKEDDGDDWKNKRRLRTRNMEEEEEDEEEKKEIEEEDDWDNWKNKRRLRTKNMEEENKEEEDEEEKKDGDHLKDERWLRTGDLEEEKKVKEEEDEEMNRKDKMILRLRDVLEDKVEEDEENKKDKPRLRARDSSEEEKKEWEEKPVEFKHKKLRARSLEREGEEVDNWKNKRRVRARDVVEEKTEEEIDEGNSNNRVRDEEKEEEILKNKTKVTAREEKEEEKLDNWKSRRRVRARDEEEKEEEEKEATWKSKRRVRARNEEEEKEEEEKEETWKSKRKVKARDEEEVEKEEEKEDTWKSKRRFRVREEQKEEGMDEGNWMNKRRLRTRNEEEEKEEEDTWKNKRLRAKEMELEEENWKSKRRLRIRVVDKKEDDSGNDERELVNNVSAGIKEGKNDYGKEAMYEEMEENVEEEAEEEGKEEETREEGGSKEEEPDEDEDATDLLLQINEKIKEYDEEEEDPVPHLNQVEERTKGVVIKHNNYISNLRLVSPHRSRESSVSNDRCSSPRSVDADESDIDDSDSEHFFIRSSSPLRLEARREEKLKDDARSETSCSASKDDEYLEGPFLRPVEDSVTSNDTEHRHSEGDPPNRPSLKRKISLKAIREAEMRKNGMSKKRKRDSHHRKTKNRKRRSSDDISDQPVYSIVRTPTRDSPSKISIKIHSPSKISPKKLQLDEEATKLRQRILISASPRPSLKSYRIPKKKPVISNTLSNGPAKMEPPEIDPFEFVDELDEPAHKPETRSRKKLIEDEIDSESSCSDRQFENVDKEVSLCVQGRDSPYKGGGEENVTPACLTTAQANIAREERLKKRNLSSRIRDAAVRFLNSTINL